MILYDPQNNKMLAEEMVDCHVLVIGSGGAGVRAAIEASQYGDTVLVSKTIVGKGGCTTMAEGGYNAVLKEEDSCGIHYDDLCCVSSLFFSQQRYHRDTIHSSNN